MCTLFTAYIGRFDQEGWGLARVLPVSGLVGNFLVHIMAGRGRVCWRSTASFPRCGKFLGIPSMSEVYEQLGELVKGFVFDAGRLGVVRDVEMLNPI